MRIRIALVGDFDPDVPAHRAIPGALELSSMQVLSEVEPVWIDTLILNRDVRRLRGGFHGVWCVPGSPYRSMDGALSAISFARKNQLPFLGTCAGFQHAIIEYARSVLQMHDADHAESNPRARIPLISQLNCSLMEQEARVLLDAGSRIASIYGKTEAVERYRCNFGFNPLYYADFEKCELKMSGRDPNGEVRVIELNQHPFFIATLYQPERSGLGGHAHPVISAFVRAARDRAQRSDKRAFKSP